MRVVFDNSVVATVVFVVVSVLRPCVWFVCRKRGCAFSAIRAGGRSSDWRRPGWPCWPGPDAPPRAAHGAGRGVPWPLDPGSTSRTACRDPAGTAWSRRPTAARAGPGGSAGRACSGAGSCRWPRRSGETWGRYTCRRPRQGGSSILQTVFNSLQTVHVSDRKTFQRTHFYTS